MSEMSKEARVSVKFVKGRVEGVVVRPLKKFVDERGWLAELFRHDELDAEFHPTMAYISVTEPGVTRGPHEHVDQADLFCFIGPSNFKLRVWDNRRESPTYNVVMTVYGGADNPLSILIPKGVVHAYRNVGSVPGVVVNCPNRLFMGPGRAEPVDEIRHEDEPDTPYRIED
jgi:dTDP-4-dehydrorhamnose 3,5-epimerase